MKRRALIRHLTANGCALMREGASHSVFVHAAAGTTSVVPRHSEINDFLARKICRDLGVPEPRST